MLTRKLFTGFIIFVVFLSGCTSISPVKDKMINGSIDMSGNADVAELTFRTSPDGRSIVLVMFNVTNITCGEFTAGSISNLITDASYPIKDGKFSIQSQKYGTINGEFTSPDTLQGTIHILITTDEGSQVECGTWNWKTPKE